MFCFFTGFVLGYAVGRFDIVISYLRKENTQVDNPLISFSPPKGREKLEKPKIEIDDRKFVTNVSTDSFDAPSEKLGTVTKSSDDILSAADKLSRLKNRKG